MSAGNFSYNEEINELTAEWQSWGLLGNSDPMTFRMTGELETEPGVATFMAEAPWEGAVSLYFGQISGDIIYAERGITATVFGNYGAGQLIAYYVMPTIAAEEYTVLQREFTATDVSLENNSRLLADYVLFQNYPNPFNPSTKISFYAPTLQYVSLEIFNLKGEKIATLVNGELPRGVHNYTFDASELASGIYFYQLRAAGFIQTRKFTLLK
ncbi:T9SS type A sorting domain-containing protein [candidate division KSB1 bacterium]|nr:T9SS type A sorting domain-containing protein [candidate division KSB1 bacterium]